MAVALPMESNPDIMNKYLQKLGVSEEWRMVDVIGLDGDALALVPKPVLAVILLFPLSAESKQSHAAEEKGLGTEEKKASSDVFHLKQVLSNVCGTIALVHSVANNTQTIQLKDGLLKSYIENAKNLDSKGKGVLLENSKAILDAYKEIVNTENDTREEPEETVNNHFVTFIHKDNHLYELDGRKSFPIDHGPTTSESFLEDTAKVCRAFIEREPDNIGFNVVALVPGE